MGFVHFKRKWLISGIVLLTFMLVGIKWSNDHSAALAQEGGIGAMAFSDATYSSPIVVANGGGQVWVVNPDDDSVSVINPATNQEIQRIAVGDEPQNIAIDPDGKFVYVANTADNSVTIIRVAPGGIFGPQVEETFTTGAEPYNLVISPDGRRVFVANSGQDTITVIRADVDPPVILGNVRLDNTICNGGGAQQQRHFQPRGLAVTANNQQLYVARFLSFVRPGGVQGDDVGKEGIVCRMNINTLGLPNAGDVITSFTPISLAPRGTGFTVAINNVQTATQAYPNQLQSIVISGTVAYLPNIAASPDAPLRFNVDTHAFVNMIGGVGSGAQTDLGAVNLHLGARTPEPGKEKLFFANPWAIALAKDGTAYAVSAGSDLLVKLNVAANGTLGFTGGASTTRYIDLNPNDPAETITFGRNAGKNPLGIAIRDIGIPAQRRAYVMNYISRNVSVVDIGVGSPNRDKVIAVVNLTDLPAPNTPEEQHLVGAEIFFSSRGHFERPGGTTVSTSNRLSSEGWQNCASCHFAGLTDANIWIFGAGPRKSVPLNGTWSPHNPNDQRILNYSAIFDEVEDFEANIRNVSGPGFLDPPTNTILDPNHGLIFGNTINDAPAAVPSLLPIANAGRPEHTVRLPGSNKSWPALEALREWIRFAIRTPNGALTASELTSNDPNKIVAGQVTLGNPSNVGGINTTTVNQGRRLFFQARCQECHGGTKWTVSSKDFTSPPAAGEVFNEAPAANVVGVTFLNRFLSNIDSFNLGVAGGPNPFGGNIGAIERANKANASSENGFIAIGTDHNGDGRGNGFNIPSLLGIWALQPYYHNGACETLNCVLGNADHRTVRGTRPDILNTQGERDAVIAFLKTLDAETEFPLNLYIDPHDISLNPPTAFKGRPIEVGANVSLFGTVADLSGLFADLGLSQVTVAFTLTTTAGTQTNSVALSPGDFNQDFGQSVDANGLPVVTTTFNIPANAGAVGSLQVRVDSNSQLPETQERDNLATRRVLIFPEPPDRTPPQVGNVIISDDNPFNDNDQIVQTANVKIKFVASDPTSPAPQPTSGLKSFCVVRYSYNTILRRWVHSACSFQPLPAQTGPNTFIVDATLQPVDGVAYAFVWVSDNAGNISRQPGFDFASFIRSTPINLNRNDARFFRITTNTPLQFDFDVIFGDIDVSVFQGFSNTSPRCALSANNGDANESVTIGSGACTGTQFQIEVRAIANSRFTIDAPSAVTGSGNGGLQAAANPLTPLVGGPPARLTAIELAEENKVYLPLITK